MFNQQISSQAIYNATFHFVLGAWLCVQVVKGHLVMKAALSVGRKKCIAEWQQNKGWARWCLLWPLVGTPQFLKLFSADCRVFTFFLSFLSPFYTHPTFPHWWGNQSAHHSGTVACDSASAASECVNDKPDLVGCWASESHHKKQNPWE